MGLFSFVGKALKAVSKVASFVPGIGGTISKVTGTVGNLLDHKAPMSTTSTKARLASLGRGAGVVYMRGNTPPGMGSPGGSMMQAQVLRSSPVMPGGAIATTSGPKPKSASPPRTYGGSGGKKKASYTRKRATAKKRSGGRTKARKLKFGSAAYRKKYLKHRR